MHAQRGPGFPFINRMLFCYVVTASIGTVSVAAGTADLDIRFIVFTPKRFWRILGLIRIWSKAWMKNYLDGETRILLEWQELPARSHFTDM